jgi:hypothetical protein
MTRYAVSPDAACAPVEDGAVVLHMRTKRYYSLNETGAMIWRLLEDEAAIDDVVARVIELYDVDGAEARRTVAVLLDELAAEALIAPVTA